jgi:hypothetical protein
MTDNPNDSITDEELKAAIKACRPFEYLKDFKIKVANYLRCPDFLADQSPHGFGYRVYCLNRKIEEEEFKSRITSMGFIAATAEMLADLKNHKNGVEMLLGAGGSRERVQLGTIKDNGLGGYIFIPKGNRTKGFFPGYIRLAAVAGKEAA